VPESRLATANAVYSSGIYVGGALASLSILLDNQLGWRGTSLAAGGFGLGVSLLSFLALRENRQGIGKEETAEDEAEAMVLLQKEEAVAVEVEVATVHEEVLEGGAAMSFQVRGAVKAMKKVVESPFVRVLFAASALRFCAGYGIGVWKAPFYRQAFPSFQNEFSVANAFVISAGGVLSSILGGLIADKYAPTDPKVRLWVPAAGSLLAVPFWIGAVKADSFEASIGLLFGEYIVAECWFGPALASLYKGVPKEVQGTAQGLFTVLTAFGNVMPVLIGSLQKENSLPDVLAVTVSGAYILSGLLFFYASTFIEAGPTEMKSAEAER